MDILLAQSSSRSSSLNSAWRRHAIDRWPVSAIRNRSATACDILARNGYTQIANVRGGMTAWMQAGLPIEK